MPPVDPGDDEFTTGRPYTGTVSDHEQRNVLLRMLVLDMAARIPDRGTNKTGDQPSYFVKKWLSDRKLHLNPDAAIRALVELIETRANQLSWPGIAHGTRLNIVSMWAIVSRSGMAGVPHTHTGRISGAYYVDTGNCDGDRNAALAVYSPDGKELKVIPPQAGLLLLFPHDMPHGVLRYEGDQPRIVISFNLA